jgi:hypothetical protein
MEFKQASAARRESRALNAGSIVFLRRRGGFYSLARVGSELGDREFIAVILVSRGPGGSDGRLAQGEFVRIGQQHAFRLPGAFLEAAQGARKSAKSALAAQGIEPSPRWFLEMLAGMGQLGLALELPAQEDRSVS